MIDEKEIGRRIKKALRISGKTEYELAKILGYSESTIHGYILGKHMPNIFTLMNIAEVLKTTPDYILGFSNSVRRKGGKSDE